MKPIIHNTVYRMKGSHTNYLTGGKVKDCAFHCGNKFRYFEKSAHRTNMECMRCGYQYHTDITTFWNRYEEDSQVLMIKDPNFLFKLRKQS